MCWGEGTDTVDVENIIVFEVKVEDSKIVRTDYCSSEDASDVTCLSP